MKLFDLADKNGAAIRAAGNWAISRLKAKSVAAHYLDASVGPGIIEELPDGRRYSLDVAKDDTRAKGGAVKGGPVSAAGRSSLRRVAK